MVCSAGVIYGLALIQIMHIKIHVKTICKKNAIAQIGTNVRAHIFNARLLARSQFASRKS
jgi:hypothetical protein